MSAAAEYLHPLPWDSDFLGFSVARLPGLGLEAAGLPAVLAAARAQGIRLLYVVLQPGQAALAAAVQAAGAELMDRKTTFLLQPLPATAVAPNSAIETTQTYSPALESLAWQSGEYSRFRLDARFDPQVFRRLYARWLRNSLSGAIARQVLVWRGAGGQELGLLTLGEKNGRADIGLLAVDTAARGQRVGQHLVQAAVQAARAGAYPALQVVTQGANEGACRFYRKCGFALETEEHIYHCWL